MVAQRKCFIFCSINVYCSLDFCRFLQSQRCYCIPTLYLQILELWGEAECPNQACALQKRICCYILLWLHLPINKKTGANCERMNERRRGSQLELSKKKQGKCFHLLEGLRIRKIGMCAWQSHLTIPATRTSDKEKQQVRFHLKMA